MCAVPLTLRIVVHNVVSVQVGQCLESAPEDVFGVVHHQLQHGGLLLVLHQEVGEGTVAHLGQVALQVTTHAGHEVVAEVAGGTKVIYSPIIRYSTRANSVKGCMYPCARCI